MPVVKAAVRHYVATRSSMKDACLPIFCLIQSSVVVNVFMATSFAQWTLASRWACFRFNLSATLSFRYSQLSWLTLSLSFCCHASGTRHNVISSATTQPTSPLTKSAADDGKCTLITTRPRSTTRKMRTSLPLSLLCSFAASDLMQSFMMYYNCNYDSAV